MDTNPAPSPTASLLRCWTPAARVLLLVLAFPLAARFVLSSRGGVAAPAPRWPDLKVDANTAPAPVLEALPGLGPALVERIDEARSSRPLRSLADLDRRVKGIGPSKAAALRPFLRSPDGR